MNPALAILPIVSLVVISLSHCSKAPVSRSDTAIPNPEDGRKHQDGPRAITLFTWDEYVDSEVIADFSAISGTEVIYETFSDTDEIEAAIRSDPGKYDVLIVDSENVELFQELQLLHPLDHTKLPHFENLDPRHTDPDIDPGNQHAVPYLWGTTLIAYRKDKIPHPEESWRLLWNPSLKGKIGMLAERSEAIGAALIKNGFSFNERASRPLATAQADLITQVTQLDAEFIEGIPSTLRKAFDQGIWATMAYNGDAVMIAEEDERIDYFVPQEGCAMWVDYIVISRDTSRSADAHAFIDYLLTAEAAAKNANAVRYATPNQAALPLLDDDLRSNPGVFPPPEIIDRCEVGGSMTPERERPLNDVWREVISRYEQRKESPGSPAEEATPPLTTSAEL